MTTLALGHNFTQSGNYWTEIQPTVQEYPYGDISGAGWVKEANIEDIESDLANQIIAAKSRVGVTSETKGIKRFISEMYILNLFVAECKTYSHYIDNLSDMVFSKTETVIKHISSFQYDSIAFELTPDKSGIFTLRFKEDKKLYIELYYSPLGGDAKEAFFALYQNKKCLDNGIGSIEEVISKGKELLQ